MNIKFYILSFILFSLIFSSENRKCSSNRRGRSKPGICVEKDLCSKFNVNRTDPEFMSILNKAKCNRKDLESYNYQNNICTKPNNDWINTFYKNAKAELYFCPCENITPIYCTAPSLPKTDVNTKKIIKEDTELNYEFCGENNANKVSHGQVTNIGDYKFMALLTYNEPNYICSGTLITARYVLTAAHCINNNLTHVRLGEHDRSVNPDCYKKKRCCAPPVKEIIIEYRIIYKHYIPDTRIDDIGLLKLSKSISLSLDEREYINTICLPINIKIETKRKLKFLIAGWGSTEKARNTSDVLLDGVVQLTDINGCRKKLKVKHIRENNTICVDVRNNSVNFCGGDSGGPLFNTTKLDVRGAYVQFGILKSGMDCAEHYRKFSPSTATKVENYISWIQETIKCTYKKKLKGDILYL